MKIHRKVGSDVKIAGIVAEYNPFHNGHAHQIDQTRAAGASHIVAVMGGNFLQRGAPAQFEKHVRAEAALRCGADLVLELPLPASMATAERFAAGAVGLMQALGCVDLLSFGAESPLEELFPLVDALLDEELSGGLRVHLQTGVTFARARQTALEQRLGAARAELLLHPNNILGVEYLKAARRLDFAPELLAVPRRGAAHDSTRASGRFASASLLRESMAAQGLGALRPYLPPAAWEVYGRALDARLLPADPSKAEAAILAVLRRLNEQELASLPDLSEGLEHRLSSAIRQARSLDELYAAVKSKRYPLARIRRLVLSAYLGLTRTDVETPPPYLRVLGFNRRGAEVLNRAKQTARLPLSSSLAKLKRMGGDCARFARLEARSTDLYVLTLPGVLPCGYDYTCPPVLLKETIPHPR